jgi:hypothetical protein
MYKKPGESALGSIIRSDGVVNLHKGNVVFPASLSRQRPGDWLSQAAAFNSRLKSKEGFRESPARATSNRDLSARSSSEFNVGGASIEIGNINVSVPAGSTATNDPRALARMIADEVQRQAAAKDDALTKRQLAQVERRLRFRHQIGNETA